ncbi:hypothetical protein HYV74_04415 [Candidatus Uhrbacteria bacterium]|nr:hypothetical protein [Candidatus Uhrbacteria bacterium]
MSFVLTPAEQRDWELRLGWRVQESVVWGVRVVEYLYEEVAEDRRVLHVAHALRVYPYVPRIERGVFAERRIGPLALAECEPACRRLLDALLATAREQRWGADEFAAQCVERLSPLDTTARAYVFGNLFHERGCCPFTSNVTLGITLSEGDHWSVLVRYRDIIAPIVRRLRHFACCMTADELAGAFDQCAQITAAAERRVVLVHLALLIISHRDQMRDAARMVVAALQGSGGDEEGADGDGLVFPGSRPGPAS